MSAREGLHLICERIRHRVPLEAKVQASRGHTYRYT